IDAVETRLEWPVAVADAQEWWDALESWAAARGTPEQRGKTERLGEDLELCIQEKDAERLKRKRREIINLRYAIMSSQDDYWVRQLLSLDTQKGTLKEPARAAMLLEQGHNFIAQNNIQALRNIVQSLWHLMPQRPEDKTKRGVGSTVARR
ncbi:MAG: hypothetical protein JWO94_3273, partial [Verrucomicrobiaceae bacterium]|nr:hypothetical protein [Verrucomicrobiaceae bacterium]